MTSRTLQLNNQAVANALRGIAALLDEGQAQADTYFASREAERGVVRGNVELEYTIK